MHCSSPPPRNISCCLTRPSTTAAALLPAGSSTTLASTTACLPGALPLEIPPDANLTLASSPPPMRLQRMQRVRTMLQPFRRPRPRPRSCQGRCMVWSRSSSLFISIHIYIYIAIYALGSCFGFSPSWHIRCFGRLVIMLLYSSKPYHIWNSAAIITFD